MKKVICIAGKNDIAVEILKYLNSIYGENRNIEILAIPNNTDVGKNSWQQSLVWYCLKNNIRMVTLSEVYNIENLVFLSLEFNQLIKTNKFKTTELFNVHFSLLPKYKGMYTSAMVLLNGEFKTGTTLHRIRDGIDTGEIIAQKSFDIGANFNCLDVYKNLVSTGIELVKENLDILMHRRYKLIPQSDFGSTYYSREVIDYNKLELDCKATAYQISNQIRAFCFRPYQLLNYNGIGLIGSRITDNVSTHKPGTILHEDKYSFTISTIDYDVVLYKDMLNELLYAIECNDNDEAKRICKSGLMVNDQNMNGWSPLIVATYYNNIEMVNYLLKNNANIKILNNNGTNLLMYAKEAYKNTGDNTLFKMYKQMGLSEFDCDYENHNLLYYLDKDNICLAQLLK